MWDNRNHTDLLYRVLAYNLEHRNPDMLGRYVGGEYTKYAATGGRIGKKHLPKQTTISNTIINHVLAGYGASIKAVASGHRSAEKVIQSLLTAHTRGPSVYPNNSRYNFTKAELEIFEKAEEALIEMNGLTQLAPRPVLIAEFCLRPENIELKGLCK